MVNLRVRTLARAAHVVGGVDALAERLAIKPVRLAQYLRGDLPVPGGLFLRASEIVTSGCLADAAGPVSEEKPKP